MRFQATALAAMALLLTGGTCVDSDIGSPCHLQKTHLDPTIAGCEDVQPDQAGQRPECFRPILEDLEKGQDKDFISFGAAECDNLTCVRARGSALPDSEADPAGTCSGECITDADCEGTQGTYRCRSLVFDDAFLRDLREALTEEEYERYLGRIQNAKFCTSAGSGA